MGGRRWLSKRLAVSGWRLGRAIKAGRPDDWLGVWIFRSQVSAIRSQVRVIRFRLGFRKFVVLSSAEGAA